MNTQNLKFAVGILILIGMVFTAVPFVGSLSPSRKADSLVASIDVGQLEQGTFIEAQSQYGQVFALRVNRDELVVYLVPYRDGHYWLPDPDWARPFYPCVDFGPDSEGNNLVRGGLFRCSQAHVEWMTTDESMTWELSGENKAGHIADMQIPKYEQVGNQLIIKGAP